MHQKHRQNNKPHPNTPQQQNINKNYTPQQTTPSINNWKIKQTSKKTKRKLTKD